MAVAIISEKTSPACREALRAQGYSILLCPSAKALSAPLAYHPDMQMARLGSRILCGEDFFLENRDFFSALGKLCKNAEVTPLPDCIGARYPADCAYNLLVMGDAVFYNPKSIAPSLLGIADALGYRLYPTKQGYAACTVCALGAHRAITADEGMAEALSLAGIEVLKIESRGIALPPYEYGFIGGASGVHERNVFFHGRIESHPSYAKMKDFAKEGGYSLVSLSDERLCDLGGILFIE